MTRQRWLVLASHVPPGGGLGGMIRYTVEVTRSLERRTDVAVNVHCRRESAPFFASELGIPERRLHPVASGSTVAASLGERYSMHRLAAGVGADVVFGSKQLLPRFSGRALRVLTVHDMLPLDRPSDFGPAKRVLLPPAYRRSIGDADLLACVSRAARSDLLRHVPAVERRAVVVPNAMTGVLASAEPEPLHPLIGRRFALLVGDLSRRKNAGFVIRLWPDVVARVPDAHLALIGPPGWGRNEPLPELHSLVDAGSASVLGRVGDGQLRWAYEEAMVTMCPSLLEGFGLPVLEALSLGCPAIISCDPAQVEAAGGRATTIDVAEPDRWVAAIVDHLERRRAPAPGPQNVRTWDDVAADLVAAVAGSGAVVDRGPTPTGRER